jgi:hypothetical protein
MQIGDSMVMVSPPAAREVLPSFLDVHVDDADATLLSRGTVAGLEV